MAFTYTHIEKGFRFAGLYPRDSQRPLQNPKIKIQDMVTMTNSKRSALPITGGILTSDVFITELKEKEKLKKPKKNEKKIIKYFRFLNFSEKPRKKRKLQEKKQPPGIGLESGGADQSVHVSLKEFQEMSSIRSKYIQHKKNKEKRLKDNLLEKQK